MLLNSIRIIVKQHFFYPLFIFILIIFILNFLFVKEGNFSNGENNNVSLMDDGKNNPKIFNSYVLFVE